MDLRTLLGPPPEAELRYDDLNAAQKDVITSRRLRLEYDVQDLEQVGRDAGHPELIQISAHIRGACASLSLIEAGIRQEELRHQRENPRPMQPGPVPLEGKEGGN